MKRPARQFWPVAAVALVVVAAAFFWWWFPLSQVPAAHGKFTEADRIAAINSIRQTVAQSLGGVVLLAGLYFTWRQLAATTRSVEVSQEGQITDRFTRAIDQLGSDRLEIRIGGIYGLERIARDSERDYWPTMETLTTFVRERTPLGPGAPELCPDGEIVPPPADVQAVLTVLGRGGGVTRGLGVASLHLDETRLQGSSFYNATLADVSFIRSWLRGSFWAGARLVDVDLRVADLRQAYFADMQAAVISVVEGQGVDQVQNRWITPADFFRSRMDGAYLVGAFFGGVTAQGLVLCGAHLDRAVLWDVVFDEVLVAGATMHGADLRGADLRGVFDLSQAQVNAAITGPSPVTGNPTRLPDGVTLPSSVAAI